LLIVTVLAGTITWILQDDESNVASQYLTPIEAGEIDPDAEGVAFSAPFTVEDARQFAEFQLLWLGEEFMGHGIHEIIRTKYDPPPPAPDFERGDTVTFVYGYCTPDPGQFPANEATCPAPITIHVSAYCTMPPELITQFSPTSTRSIRGVTSTSFESRNVNLWTADTHVSITVADPSIAVDDAVAALHSLVPPGPKAGENLQSADANQC
jgi:hypothetical protein